MPQDVAVAVAVPATSLNWAALKNGGLKAGLDAIVAANATKANPTTTATVVNNGGGGSGGSLPAGTYYVSYSFVDAFGETLIGGRSASFTTTGTMIPRVTLPSLPSNVNQINLYCTPTGGAAGTEYLYATGIAATTFDMSYALPTDPGATQPQANTTGITAHTYQVLQSLAGLNADYAQNSLSGSLTAYLSGAPIERREFFRQMNWREGVTKAWNALEREISVLIVANQGTLGTVSGSVMHKTVRTFS